ncbi:MAG: peptidyl-prolyl cis-trans isomerase, partial [Candidatus Omnitrophica bacterium]|nr:peptidyl-prolyl cis-trans isomerase [Candidatus Omnitrophota bacterium]
TILPKDLEKTVRFKDSDLKEYFQKNKIKFLSPPSMKLRYVKLPFPEDAGVQKQVETKFKAIAIYNEYVKKQGDLKQLAQKQNFTALDTRYFSIANPDIELGLNLEQLRNIFQMEKNLISQPIELTDGYLLAKMLDKKDTYIPAFNLIYEDIKNAYIADQAMALTKDKAVDILENIKKAMNKRYEQTTFVETITTLKLASEQTPLLAANEIIAYMGIEPDQKHKLFALSSENPLSDVIRTNQDYRIFYLEEKIAADETAFQEEKTEFTNNILTEIKNEKFADFVEEIKTKADVQIY